MNKWFSNENVDSSLTISSRVRLARNLSGYPFSARLIDSYAYKMIEQTKSALESVSVPNATNFNFNDFKTPDALEDLAMYERHLISRELLNSKRAKALLYDDSESVSIMLGEEDHIRIQTIMSGDCLDECLQKANEVDDSIEATVDYAFDENFGYLTSCPTNTGTGLRASYMVFLPLLETSGQLKKILTTISKFGMTIRGKYGEGTESTGHIYQISNQITLGKSEKEILGILKNITEQIITQEKYLWGTYLKEHRLTIEDNINRSYGILRHCKKISSEEATDRLADLRLGYLLGVFNEPKLKVSIYNAIINIQKGNLLKDYKRSFTEEEESIIRSNYLKSIL